MKNIFIVIDGMDGAGKSEVVCSVQAALYKENKNLHVLTTREPTGGQFGAEIREILRTQEDPFANREKITELFVQDRKEHVDTLIQPFLAEGENRVLLCDRYYYSTIVFQHTQGADKAELIEKNSSFPRPDLAIILDLDVDVAMGRFASRDKETFEKKEFMDKLRMNYQALKADLSQDNIKMVDAGQSKEEVCTEVLRLIREVISA